MSVICTRPFYAEESVTIVAGPSVLNQSGEWVRVNWSGVILPQKQDWIGVWLLPNDSFTIDAKQQAPVKYQVYGFDGFMGHRAFRCIIKYVCILKLYASCSS